MYTWTACARVHATTPVRILARDHMYRRTCMGAATLLGKLAWCLKKIRGTLTMRSFTYQASCLSPPGSEETPRPMRTPSSQ